MTRDNEMHMVRLIQTNPEHYIPGFLHIYYAKYLSLQTQEVMEYSSKLEVWILDSTDYSKAS